MLREAAAVAAVEWDRRGKAGRRIRRRARSNKRHRDPSLPLPIRGGMFPRSTRAVAVGEGCLILDGLERDLDLMARRAGLSLNLIANLVLDPISSSLRADSHLVRGHSEFEFDTYDQ